MLNITFYDVSIKISHHLKNFKCKKVCGHKLERCISRYTNINIVSNISLCGLMGLWQGIFCKSMILIRSTCDKTLSTSKKYLFFIIQRSINIQFFLDSSHLLCFVMIYTMKLFVNIPIYVSSRLDLYLQV